MRYVVHGYRRQVISTEIEADSPAEAMELAGSGSVGDIDVWDTDFEWHIAYPEG